jgi:urease accessory protein UreF
LLIGKGDRPDLIEVVGGLVALALTSDMTAGAAAAMARRVERAEKAQQHLAEARAAEERAAEERAAEEQREKAVKMTNRMRLIVIWVKGANY